MEISNSGANPAVSHAQITRRGLVPIETCISGKKGAVLQVKTTADVWDPWILVFLVLITLFCMHKTTGEVWDSSSLLILVINTLL